MGGKGTEFLEVSGLWFLGEVWVWESPSLLCPTQTWNTVAESDQPEGWPRAWCSGSSGTSAQKALLPAHRSEEAGTPAGEQCGPLCLWVKAEHWELSFAAVFQEAGWLWELLELAARPRRL